MMDRPSSPPCATSTGACKCPAGQSSLRLGCSCGADAWGCSRGAMWPLLREGRLSCRPVEGMRLDEDSFGKDAPRLLRQLTVGHRRQTAFSIPRSRFLRTPNTENRTRTRTRTRPNPHQSDTMSRFEVGEVRTEDLTIIITEKSLRDAIPKHDKIAEFEPLPVKCGWNKSKRLAVAEGVG
jgi:hypothetical protein